MSNTPKHCEIAIEYFTLAKELGSYEEANKYFECCDNPSCWYGLDGGNASSFYPNLHYRRKPETHMVNGHEVPAPYRVSPAIGDHYYSISTVCGTASDCWTSTDFDVERLISNNCFRSESDAEENRLAMFKLGKYAEVKV
jgi:hypothetical protein